MGSGVTSARSVHQLLLACKFLFEFLVAAVLHFADIFKVVDFGVLLSHLFFEVFALCSKGLLGFNAAIQFLAETSFSLQEQHLKNFFVMATVAAAPRMAPTKKLFVFIVKLLVIKST